MNSRSIGAMLVLTLGVFALALFAPRAWATPAQNPSRQTVPTRVRTQLPPPPPPPPSPPTQPPAPPLLPTPRLIILPPNPTAGQPSAATSTPTQAPTTAVPSQVPTLSPTVRVVTPTPTSKASSTPTHTLTAVVGDTYTETPLPTVTLAASTEASAGGGVSPLLCGGGALVLIGVAVWLLGKRRER